MDPGETEVALTRFLVSFSSPAYEECRPARPGRFWLAVSRSTPSSAEAIEQAEAEAAAAAAAATVAPLGIDWWPTAVGTWSA